MIDYLTLVEVLAIHEELIRLYGGADGIRDMGALESALYRPQSGYYSDIIEEAAALWESLSQNHPFIDGNKRIAFACTYTFLMNNDIEIDSDPNETYAFMMSLYEDSNFTFKELAIWLRKNTKPV